MKKISFLESKKKKIREYILNFVLEWNTLLWFVFLQKNQKNLNNWRNVVYSVIVNFLKVCISNYFVIYNSYSVFGKKNLLIRLQ